ncbi:hypothetical protein FE257_006000 [Aspergillus nanangensis]|uniref:Chromosome segregation protein BIR1 n=1 Tax=Aspergillus nanangensis TaxID=2582783 RepID=A0AAD4CPL8_ASPNN|nr:hypothetical protein FE257_006000 [Aspergillus nanangensis]
MPQDMETFAARLASFDRVLHPEKRRSSSAKTAKPITWPHSSPSPAELAHAGFFYNPYETNPDNTTCFMCRRALDGWEEEDNPTTEHLKHAKDCGWAIMMDIQQHSSNPSEIEDPTCDTIRDARLATFGTQWPHDGKEEWVCSSEKMVEGGWYFCPTEESNDLASCAYCKLSLDGWEPQDDPFDEHYRRSSSCSFFVYAQPPGKKVKGKKGRAKKTRTSKTSRLSTQSTASEAPASDLDEMMDQSIMSQTSTKAKGAKKSTKSKPKTSKSKKEDPVETDDQMDLDELEPPTEEPSKPKRTTRGKKRASEDMEQEDPGTHNANMPRRPGRPAKKRATNTRSNIQQERDQDSEIIEVPHQEEKFDEEEPSKSRSVPKKSGRGRKPSNASTAKMASSSHLPQESEQETALESDLETREEAPVDPKPETKKKQPSTKSKSKKKQKAAPEPVDDDLEDELAVDINPEPRLSVATDVEEPSSQKATASTEIGKGKASSYSEVEQNSHGYQGQSDVDSDQDKDSKSPRRESFNSVEIQRVEPEADLGAEPAEKATKKNSKKKSSAEKTKKPKKAERASPEPSVLEEPLADYEKPRSQSKEQEIPEENLPGQDKPETAQEQTGEPSSARRRSSKVPPKTAQRYSDLPQEKLYAQSLAGSRSSDGHDVSGDNKLSAKDVSPLPSAQSSDAENHPPSTRPTPRAPLVSPAKQQSARVPLAPNTPSPSKRNANMGGINTKHPWNPIDIDELILANPGDAENLDFSSALKNIKGDLSSPERKMTVEEWIRWNAKNGEEKLRRECERLVGHFESEGARAMRVLEGIECID